MKSCFSCRFCSDVVELSVDEKSFKCTVPLPPWRFRSDDSITTGRDWCYSRAGYIVIPSGDAMAEHCHCYEAKP